MNKMTKRQSTGLSKNFVSTGKIIDTETHRTTICATQVDGITVFRGVQVPKQARKKDYAPDIKTLLSLGFSKKDAGTACGVSYSYTTTLAKK